MAFAARFSLPFARHLVTRPYRRGIPPAAVRARPSYWSWRIAAYDTFLEFFLKGYEELSGSRPRQGSGQLAVLFNRIAFAIDDEVEARLGKHSLDFQEIIQTATVRQHVATLGSFLRASCSQQQAEAIIQALWQAAERDYGRYARTLPERPGKPNVTDLLEDASIDSGGILRHLAHILGLFQGVHASNHLLEDYFHLGVAGKLADDLRDVRLDYCNGANNILVAMLEDEESEAALTRLAIDSSVRMGEKWWGRTCPLTYSRFSALYNTHYSRLSSTNLRLAGDVMLLPGLLGLSVTKGESTGARM